MVHQTTSWPPTWPQVSLILGPAYPVGTSLATTWPPAQKRSTSSSLQTPCKFYFLEGYPTGGGAEEGEDVEDREEAQLMVCSACLVGPQGCQGVRESSWVMLCNPALPSGALGRLRQALCLHSNEQAEATILSCSWESWDRRDISHLS